MHVPKNGAPEYMKQRLTGLREEIEISKIKIGDFGPRW